MYRRILVPVLALAAVTALAGTASAKTIKTAPEPRYYLALGDSLAQGQQPNLQGTSMNTNEGYADDLYQTELKRIHGLQLVKLGCGGEGTQSMISGRGNRYAGLYHCHPAGGSQLAAATRFLRAHHDKGEVPLITIDIGANDVDTCAAAADVGACITAGTSAIATDLPKILSTIKKAAPKGTTLAAMNLYDPVLGGYFAPAGSAINTLATASPLLLKSINEKLGSIDQAAGFKTADVAGAFQSYAPLTETVTWDGQQIPVAVARICAWTWACSTPPSGPNVHANKNGYAAIANAFRRAIEPVSAGPKTR